MAKGIGYRENSRVFYSVLLVACCNQALVNQIKLLKEFKMKTDWLAVRLRLQTFELKNEKPLFVFKLTNQAKRGLIDLHFFNIGI